MSVTWVIHGLETDRYAQELISAVKATGNEQIHLTLPPFSSILPEIPEGPVVLYGGTRLIEAAASGAYGTWDKTVWFDKEKSRWSEDYARWRQNTITRNPILTTFRQAQFLPFAWDTKVFVRPDYDLKEFAGEVMTFHKLVDWRNRLVDITGEPGLTMDADTPIIVAKEAPRIYEEWRLFIVDGKVIDCSRYRYDGQPSIERELSHHLLKYVNRLLEIYNPTPVFCLDIGVDAGGMFAIIERNCFNSSGWYDVDINLVVDAVSKYVERTYNDG